MTSQTDVNKKKKGDADPAVSSLQTQVESAIGAEFGAFGAGPATLPRTCVESCLRSPEVGGVEGTCVLVQALAGGGDLPVMQCPGVCEKGHAVTVHEGRLSQSKFLVLYPANADGHDNEVSCEQLQAAGQAWEQYDRLDRENQGLADELLRSYEQLNVIFDITKEIGTHQDVAQVKLALIRRLAVTLNCEWACCISRTDGVLWWGDSGERDRDSTIRDLQAIHAETISEVSQDQRICVRNHLAGSADMEGNCLMFGPLEGAENEDADVIIFGRGGTQPEFKSGDMMMIDSVLGHGGHVISNLRLVERLKSMSFDAVRALVSAIDKKDQYTRGHSERVGFLSRLIGKEKGLPPEDQQDLEWAGLLHDVGKIGISDQILNKPGRLTDEEFEIIKQHPKMSYDVILHIQSFASVHDGVLYHHEVPDGTGYPEGLKGDEIPLMARIVHVADTFDALTSSRSYRAPFPLGKALDIMRKDTGTKLDAEIMAVFERAIEKFRTDQPHRFSTIFSHIEELKA